MKTQQFKRMLNLIRDLQQRVTQLQQVTCGLRKLKQKFQDKKRVNIEDLYK